MMKQSSWGIMTRNLMTILENQTFEEVELRRLFIWEMCWRYSIVTTQQACTMITRKWKVEIWTLNDFLMTSTSVTNWRLILLSPLCWICYRALTVLSVLDQHKNTSSWNNLNTLHQEQLIQFQCKVVNNSM